MAEAQTQTLTRRDLETRLIEKAWKDPAFRKEIVKDPKGMLEKHTGQKLPDQLKIFVYEEDANTLHFSIPPAPSNRTELSDEQLEKVAGGTELVLVTGFIFTVELASATVLAATAAASAVGTAAGVLKGTGAW
jgi:hypothetical protein